LQLFSGNGKKAFMPPSDHRAHFDPAFVRKISPFFGILEKYFRYEARGLENVPKKRALVVMNHGVIPYHGFLFAKKLIDERKIYPRGLGAEFLFRVPGLREFFLRGGAVNASPKNAIRLLRENNVIMLAPGGIYEALIAKKGLRRIPWERRKGFVELAVKTRTPIVPTYCRGINAVYFNSYFLLKPRIKLFEKTRFSLPFFFGLGLFPLPRKLIHVVGRPIRITRRRGEDFGRQVTRIHREVVSAMVQLAKRKN
jgi:1-acyl-sn-glycerol-3-phosphate acyltransferase